MNATDYVHFIDSVNHGLCDLPARMGVTLYRRIEEMFQNQGECSPFTVTLGELRTRLVAIEEKHIVSEINRLLRS